MKFSLNHSTDQYPDITIVPVAKNDSSDLFFSVISSISNIPSDLIKADFRCDAKEVHTVYFQEGGKNKRIQLVGLGENPGIKDIIQVFRSYTNKRKDNFSGNIGLNLLLKNAPADPCMWIEAAVNGIVLGFYDIGLYKTEKAKKPTTATTSRIDVFVAKRQETNVQTAIEKGQAIAETQLEIFDLVNAPSNKKTPQTLSDWALRSGKKHGYKVKVLGKKEIEALGLHALLAVNQGSENPPSFIIMEYKHNGKAVKKIGLVGKGVTFDTGGLSIKPSTNMHYMKTDMGGAAAVMGTMEVATKMQLPIHLIGVVPATENSVDSKSVKPGDVINSYAGKTIEVIDTDAEGRLILADGLAYIVKHYNPDVLIDLATLTGSCIRTFGTYAGGLFSNNDELAQQLLEASQKTGERLWQLPIWDDYKKEIKSDIADVKNFSGNPSAGAISAAKFLEVFIQDHPSWAHMDMAGVAVSDSEFSSHKSATAFGVRLLIEYMQNIVNTTKV